MKIKPNKVTALVAVAASLGVAAVTMTSRGSATIALTAERGATEGTRADAAAQQAMAPGSGQLVVDWNNELLKIVRTPGAQSPTLHPTRSFALLHAALYDAVVSITHADMPYAFEVVAPHESRPDAAADQAAHDVLAALYPSFGAELDIMLASELAKLPAGASHEAGSVVGARVAALMLALRANDGSARPAPPYVSNSIPGSYLVTPPNVGKQPAFTGWGAVTPWTLESASTFVPGSPPPLNSAAWATAINQVESLGGGQGTPSTRTADQTQIGLFWGPPIWNTWNEIADGQTVARRSSLETASHLFADLNIGFADSAIVMYDAKYTYHLWRPIMAIQTGTPTNPAVNAANPGWSPLVATALDPSYPGAHATISETGATILTRFFGRDVRLVVHSDAAGFATVTRSFSSFQAAADEASFSRILAGQHTSIDEAAGSALGGHVASFVLAQGFGRL
jgi:membrane-associated phospholipid phosphatase